MKWQKNKKIIILVLILGVSIGFALLTQQLDLIGGANIKGHSWNVHWENVKVSKKSEDDPIPSINEAGDTVTWAANLHSPGDVFKFKVDAKNDGDMNAVINSITTTFKDSGENVITKPDYMEYSVTYADGTAITNNQLLKSGQSLTYLVTIKYSVDTITSTTQAVTVDVSINYGLDDGTGVEVNIGPSAVCIRAETLHTEECTASNFGCYNAGYYVGGSKGTTTITYGNLGTQGELNTGDAFDCDVDNDGEYEEDERFYYVSPRDGDSTSEYATLIYYKSIAEGQYSPGRSSAYSYNYNGPTDIYSLLPSTSEWSNPDLNSNMTRQIKNSLGATSYNSYTYPEFTYTDRAARLLTTQELDPVCLDASSSNLNISDCEFLYENTYFDESTGTSTTVRINSESWWLETPVKNNTKNVYVIDEVYGSAYSVSTYDTYYVRPAIEVKFSDMDY